MKKVNVGIIGCGMITQTRHAPEYAHNPDANIIGFFDADKKRLDEFSRLYDAKAYSSVDDLINDADIDAVSVCSPNFTHAEYSIKALLAGKHVLCEKPIAIRVSDAKDMMDTAERVGKTLMIGHHQRLLPTHRRAKDVLDSGAIGRIISFQSSFKHSGPENWSVNRSNSTWFFDKNKAQFGSLGDLGSHKIDIVRYLIGQEFKSVNCKTMTLDKRYPDGSLINLDDNAMIMCRMMNGLPGIVNVSWTNYGQEDNSTVIYGDKGVMKIFGDYYDDIVLEMRDGSTVKYMVGKIQTNDNQIKSGIIDEFVSSIVENRAPIITGRDGYNTLATIVACAKSAETEKWEDVQY